MDVVSQNSFDHFRQDLTQRHRNFDTEITVCKERIKQLEMENSTLANRFDLLLEHIKPLLSPIELRKLGVKWVQ